MATRYQFDRPARAALLDELAAAGVPVARVEMDAAACWVTCEAGDYDRAAAVVAAHDAAALDAQAAQATADDTDDRAQLRQAVAALLADRAALLDTTTTLTVAQLRPYLARLDLGLARVIRYLGRRGL